MIDFKPNKHHITIPHVKLRKAQRTGTLIHQQRVYKNHKLYEVDIDAETIRVMPVEQSAIVDSNSSNGYTTKRSVVTKPNCLYISCLNIKNLKKLIHNAGGNDISSYKFIK